MRRSPLSLLLSGVLALAAIVPASAATPQVVEMRTLSYAPSRVTFDRPGRLIRWVNVTTPDRLHDAISSLPGYFGSGLVGTGERYQFRFTAAGTFTYICSIHDVMLGRVEVAPVVTVVDDADGTRLRVTLGSERLGRDSDYRWSVFVQGPSDGALRYARWSRSPVTEIPVAEAGAWTVMVRLRHKPTGTPSSDSPLVTVTVPG